MMSAKMATSGLLKTKIFWKKGYDVIISVHDVIIPILSRDSNYNVNVVMWPKFGNSSISVREVIITSIYKDLTRKNAFFESWSWFKFNNLGLAQVTNLKFNSNVTNGLRLKFRKFLELILTFAEVTEDKLVGGSFCPPLPCQFWIGLNEECFKWLEIWFFTVPIELKGEYHWQTRQLF